MLADDAVVLFSLLLCSWGVTQLGAEYRLSGLRAATVVGRWLTHSLNIPLGRSARRGMCPARTSSWASAAQVTTSEGSRLEPWGKVPRRRAWPSPPCPLAPLSLLLPTFPTSARCYVFDGELSVCSVTAARWMTEATGGPWVTTAVAASARRAPAGLSDLAARAVTIAFHLSTSAGDATATFQIITAPPAWIRAAAAAAPTTAGISWQRMWTARQTLPAAADAVRS